jgi:hypothetical protein
MELEAGAVYDVNDVNNYKFLDIPPIDRSVFEAYDKVDTNAKKKIGIDDPMMGVKTGGSATENAIAAQAAKDKLDLFFKMLEEDCDIRDEWLKLNIIQQFYSDPVRIEAIEGEDGKKVNKPVYRKLPINVQQKKTEFGDQEFEIEKGKYFEIVPESIGVYEDRYAQFAVKVVSRTTTPISKEFTKKRWDETLKTISLIPQFSMMANWEKLWKKTAEIDEFDPDEYSAGKDPIQEMTDLAEEENDRMMTQQNDQDGKKVYELIPPTAGATPEHNDRHRALVMSMDMKALPEEVQKNILIHYEGELKELQVTQAKEVLNQAQNIGMGGEMDENGQPTGQPVQSPAQPPITGGQNEQPINPAITG